MTGYAPHLGARTGLIRGYVPALRAFAEHRRRLQQEAVLGHGSLLEPLLAAHRSALARLREVTWLRLLSDATLRQMREVLEPPAYPGILPLRAGDLATLMELPLPFLADSAVLRHPTHAPAAEILPCLPLLQRRSGQIRRILAESSLRDSGPFRSEPLDDGRLVVRGRDAPTVEALAGIAHELGHCLYEGARPVRSALGQLASERLAQCLEERVTDEYLMLRGSERERQAWWIYQRRVDAVNLYFFSRERSLMYGSAAARGAELMPESATVLRESLFTLPGYQVVYARASLARLSAARGRDGRPCTVGGDSGRSVPVPAEGGIQR
ncbi:hypothetical protein P8605_43045 [Streptomyces sp. T-3]|nr:hypothetical protein [Streptomyces sp. T-3]